MYWGANDRIYVWPCLLCGVVGGYGVKCIYIAVCYSLWGCCLFCCLLLPVALFTAIGVIWANKWAILGYWVFFAVHPA